MEARHAGYLNLLNGESPFPDTFDEPLTRDEVLAIAGDFIVEAPAADEPAADVEVATEPAADVEVATEPAADTDTDTDTEVVNEATPVSGNRTAPTTRAPMRIPSVR